MKRVTQESRWLNVIIIVISAMILAFSLLGKFMGSGLDEKPAQVMPLPNLRVIDFGSIKLINDNQQWRSETSSSSAEVDRPGQQSNLSQKTAEQELRYSKIAAQWHQLLEQPAESATSLGSTRVENTYFVQLYFKGRDQALIVKVESVSNKNEASEDHNQTLITFVNSNLQLVKPGSFSKNILPARLINKN